MNDTPKNDQPTYTMLVNAMLAKMSDRALIAEYQLADVTEQRDQFESKLCIALRGHPDSELWGDAGLIAATMRCVDALDEVTEQRDRLAVALERLEKTAGLPAWWDDPARVQARQALQSLTPNVKP
jgi:hypothetical protein